jgi:hypothetical protein
MLEWHFVFVTREQWAMLTERNKGKCEAIFETAVKKHLLEQEIDRRVEIEVQKRLASLQKTRRTKPTKWRVIENKHPQVVSPPNSNAMTKPKKVANTKS